MKGLFLLTFLLPVTICQAQPSKVPEKAIIVLTYDDALQSQLDNVVPELNRAGLKGTFFLDGRVSQEQMESWRSAAAKGHELANHTLYHPCSKITLTNVPPQYQSESYDIKSILREIETMNKLLFGIDGKTHRTYAFPCSETSVGGKDYKDALKQSGFVKYARSGGDSNALIKNFSAINLFDVPSWAIAENTGGEQMIAFVRKVIAAKGIGVLMFHGVGGDYLKVSTEAHNLLLKFLKENKKEVRVNTFTEAMDTIGSLQNR